MASEIRNWAGAWVRKVDDAPAHRRYKMVCDRCDFVDDGTDRQSAHDIADLHNVTKPDHYAAGYGLMKTRDGS